jgi:2-keto-3-deoxy-L-rhamnonate aldolase RhmA
MNESVISRAISERGIAVGAMLYEFNTSGIMRMLAAAGVDFALFDLEHTGWDAGSLRTLYATGRGSDVYPITRVIRSRYTLIASALDAGSKGIMGPMLESEEEARLLVESAKYPPQGKRGFGVVYSDELGDGAAALTERANRENLVIAQIESSAGIRNADAIVGVDGVDVVWLGHFDLSLSLGIPGQFEHPEFLAAVDSLLDACRAHGRPLGQMISTPEEGARLRKRGFQVFAYSDVAVFEHGLRERMEALRGE